MNIWRIIFRNSVLLLVFNNRRSMRMENSEISRNIGKLWKQFADVSKIPLSSPNWHIFKFAANFSKTLLRLFDVKQNTEKFTKKCVFSKIWGPAISQDTQIFVIALDSSSRFGYPKVLCKLSDSHVRCIQSKEKFSNKRIDWNYLNKIYSY